MEDWKKNIKVEASDLQEGWAELVEVIGLEKFLELCRLYHGDFVYIPTIQSVQREARNRMIHADYRHLTEKELSKKYGLTTNQIRYILKRK